MIVSMISRSTVYFARPDALSGSLGETLKHVNPTIFFAVPRVYEKFEDKIREGMEKSSFIKKKIGKSFKLITNQLKNFVNIF
jgi:long-chain-fatty-acid--CoA ligase ACSBG